MIIMAAGVFSPWMVMLLAPEDVQDLVMTGETKKK